MFAATWPTTSLSIPVTTTCVGTGTSKEIPSRGVIVTGPSDDERFDFVSRFFAPRVGIDEDPVTGSAHCALAPYWVQRLGRNPLVGRQVGPRGGVVHVRDRGDRVDLEGQAVVILRGELLV